jgi:hypothetical protein
MLAFGVAAAGSGALPIVVGAQDFGAFVLSERRL